MAVKHARAKYGSSATVTPHFDEPGNEGHGAGRSKAPHKSTSEGNGEGGVGTVSNDGGGASDGDGDGEGDGNSEVVAERDSWAHLSLARPFFLRRHEIAPFYGAFAVCRAPRSCQRHRRRLSLHHSPPSSPYLILPHYLHHLR